LILSVQPHIYKGTLARNSTVMTGHEIFEVTDGQYQIVYDFLSFTFAAMAASTLFFWLRLPSIAEKYKSALVITGLVTAIASYHYLRIFNSWTAAYVYMPPAMNGTKYMVSKLAVTGVPFNDAYRYMDWLLTVPLLLVEIILVMDLPAEETVSKAWQLGGASALMIILGYPGELILEQSQLSTRWLFWCLAMIPFIFIVYTLIIGLANATNAEQNSSIRSKIRSAQYMTVVSWLTYPIVYIIPMLGASGADATVGIQLGYCLSDIIAKCGVGFLIYQITIAKSNAMKSGLLNNNGI
jgi:bacteriorhodopsin